MGAGRVSQLTVRTASVDGNTFVGNPLEVTYLTGLLDPRQGRVLFRTARDNKHAMLRIASRNPVTGSRSSWLKPRDDGVVQSRNCWGDTKRCPLGLRSSFGWRILVRSSERHEDAFSELSPAAQRVRAPRRWPIQARPFPRPSGFGRDR